MFRLALFIYLGSSDPCYTTCCPLHLLLLRITWLLNDVPLVVISDPLWPPPNAKHTFSWKHAKFILAQHFQSLTAMDPVNPPWKNTEQKGFFLESFCCFLSLLSAKIIQLSH